MSTVTATQSDPTAAIRRWTDMWNRVLPARDVVSTDCRVYFGRKPQIERPTTTTGPGELQNMIDVIRDRFPGIQYRADSETLHQPDPNSAPDGIISLLWNVDVPREGTKTGIDLLRHRGGLIVEVWSITGDLELPLLRQGLG
jgi:hypothetical protein